MAIQIGKGTTSTVLLIAFAASLSGCGTLANDFDPGNVEKNNAAKLGKVVSATDDEMADRQKILDRTAAAVKTEDFDTLNKMAHEFRSTRALTPSGTWKLTHFYQRLYHDFTNTEKLQNCRNTGGEQFIERWMEFSPREPAAHILAARLSRRMAWCHRGGAYAHQVPDQDMQQFASLIGQAHQTLSTAAPFASKDPEFYVEMIHLYPNMGARKSEFMDLINEAMNREPYYYDIYFGARDYFQEKWLGDPKDLERFDEYVTDATQAGVGNGLYARIHWVEMNDKTSTGDPAYQNDVDWPKWKAAMRDVATQYPNDWNLSKFASFSCKAQDYQEARYYFDRIKKNVPEAWTSLAEVLGCQNEAGYSGRLSVEKTGRW